MEHLFKFANSNQEYNVVFDHEEYIFQPLSGGQSFSLIREHDEWHGADGVDESLRQQAIESLERYLLKQH